MAGQIIVAGIGAVCLILAVMAGGKDFGFYPLIVFGLCLIAYSAYSYTKENKKVGSKPISERGKGITLDVDDLID